MRYLLSVLAISLVAATFVMPAHSARAAAGLNPCSLLSLGEARSITHFALKADEHNPVHAGGPDYITECTYVSQTQSVSIQLHDDAAYFPGNAKNRYTSDFKREPGIGERAWSATNPMAASVSVLKHGRFVTINLTDPDGLKDEGAHSYASAMQIAKIVAKRM